MPCGASAGLLAGRLGASPHNPEHRFRSPVYSAGGSQKPVEQVVSTYNTNRGQNTPHVAPRYNSPKGTRRKARSKDQNPERTRKNRATPDKEQVVGKGPRTREEAGAGERARCSCPGGQYPDVLCRLPSRLSTGWSRGEVVEATLTRARPQPPLVLHCCHGEP